ncbi:MAG: chromate transporter [Oscillospiraceae bacterium]|nr:chromate transporter [Oscillospiraceae bacterium]
MIYLFLFLEFLRMGVFAFGGGLATLPFIYELSGRTGWFTAEDVSFMVALAETTPGAIAVNMATYAGFQAAGVLGGAVATLGLTLPPIVIVGLVCKVVDRFRESWQLQAGLEGVRPAVLALITLALLMLARMTLLHQVDLAPAVGEWAALVNWQAILLFGLALAGMLKYKKHPALYIGAGAVAGLLIA